MFNRQPYNRGKFNVAGSSNIGSNGIGLMIMKNNAVLVEKIISANAVTSLIMRNKTEGTKVKFSSGLSNLIMATKANATKVFRVAGNTSNIVMLSEASQSLAGESLIILENINLKPGDELVINSCDMTITINGQNAMEFFSSESEFFNLLSGLNKLIYSDSNTSRKISFDTIWKDRWL